MAQDKMTVRIEEDGTITTVVNGQISTMNHDSADKWLKMVEKLAGGHVRRTKDKKAEHKHAHTHHDHEHEQAKA